MQHTDVIVVGAGPTGLFLASELALGGVQVTVLERLADQDPTIKAGSINVASAEILDRRGLLPALQDAQRRMLASFQQFGGPAHATAPSPASVNSAPRPRRFPAVGHFAGMLFRNDLVDQTDPVLAAHTDVADGVLVNQHELELILAEYSAGLGVTVRRGIEVHGVRSTGPDMRADADVIVDTSAGDIQARWVVAADGGRSVIRKQLGIGFPGTDAQMVAYQAVVDIEDPSVLKRGWTWTPHGICAFGPIPGRILVGKFAPQPADRDKPVSLHELQDVLREVTETQVTLTGIQGRATRWSDTARQAETYRHGRVLLAGDAAHVHSPFSGQGLNLGLGDAANLGWKLAATIHGHALDGLLDTYHAERHPIAEWVLNWTRAQVALMRGDTYTAQLRSVVGEHLLTAPGALNRMVALTSGILQQYNVTNDGVAADSTPKDTAEDVAREADSAASLVGSIAGDVELTSGARLADHAHDGLFVLLDRTPDGRHASAARDLEARVTYVADPTNPSLATAAPSLLMRPDGIIIWAATHDTAGSRSHSHLEAAIRSWVGAR